jgi:hypothetical protein
MHQTSNARPKFSKIVCEVMGGKAVKHGCSGEFQRKFVRHWYHAPGGHDRILGIATPTKTIGNPISYKELANVRPHCFDCAGSFDSKGHRQHLWVGA